MLEMKRATLLFIRVSSSNDTTLDDVDPQMTTMLLLSKGADPNARSGIMGRTPLHFASLSGHRMLGSMIMMRGFWQVA